VSGRRKARIAATTDWHGDLVTGGVERIEELRSYVDQFIAHCASTRVDIALFGGDFWDPGTILDPKWAEFTYGAMTKTWRALDRGVAIAISGNHDVIDASRPLSTLSGLRAASSGVQVCEAPQFLLYGETVSGADRVRDFDVGVLCLPYVSRTFERSEAYRSLYANAFDLAKRARDEGFPVVVVTHLMFEGMLPGSESEELARGRDVPFPISDVELLRPELIVAGHYHKRQLIRRGRLDIDIVGAPMLTTFGERDDGERGFLTAEV
jgi:DNA repair exonuclease SbcCD nuclease subunit